MIEVTSGIPENLVIAVAHGKVTGHDYETVLVPAVEAALKIHGKLRLLYQTADDFHGFSAEALWDDAKFGLKHMSEFEAVAVVTNVVWIKDAAKFFSLFMRCPVKVFTTDKIADAREWIASVPAWLSMSGVT